MIIDNFNRKKLWEGCILTTIAHAIMIERYPELTNEQSWDGINYNVQDSCGCRGTITFHKKYLVAVFQDINNKEMIEKCAKKGAFSILNIKHKIIEEIARDEALQYVLDDVNGNTVPLITTGFWGINNEIYSGYEYKTVEENGAYIITNQTKEFDENLQALINYYDINGELVKLIESIYFRKIQNTNSDIVLYESEKKILLETYGSELAECKQTLRQIDIII